VEAAERLPPFLFIYIRMLGEDFSPPSVFPLWNM
jgi:hypothetical protein